MINLLTLLLYTSEDCSTYAVKVTLIFFRICYKNRQQCLFYYGSSEKKVKNPTNGRVTTGTLSQLKCFSKCDVEVSTLTFLEIFVNLQDLILF